MKHRHVPTCPRICWALQELEARIALSAVRFAAQPTIAVLDRVDILEAEGLTWDQVFLDS